MFPNRCGELPAPAKPTLSVVLITHNGARTISEQLEALDQQYWSRPWELVIVDNASDDETPRLLDRFACTRSWVRIVQADLRASAGYARNAGIDAARGEFIAFVDDDDLVGDEWLATIGESVIEHGYVGSRLEVDRLNDPATRAARRPAQQSQIDSFLGIPVMAAPLMAVRRDWLQQVEGFDEEIWPEDTDLSLRLYDRFRQAPVFCGDAVYHYRLRTDLKSIAKQSFRYGRVRPYLLRRWRHLIVESPRTPIRSAMREWASLLLTAPLCAVDPVRRMAWARRAGQRLGHLVGSVRCRVVWP